MNSEPTVTGAGKPAMTLDSAEMDGSPSRNKDALKEVESPALWLLL